MPDQEMVYFVIGIVTLTELKMCQSRIDTLQYERVWYGVIGTKSMIYYLYREQCDRLSHDSACAIFECL